MRLLKEDFGESEELNTFIYNLQRRFNPYYVVTLKLNGKEQHRYFAYEVAAKKYYDGLLSEAKNNKIYYDGAEINWTQVNLRYEEDEQEFEFINDDSEDEEDIDIDLIDDNPELDINDIEEI